MATASVTLALNQSTFLAGIARAQGAVRGLGSSVASIGAKGFAVASVAVTAFATATAIGIKKAFDLGGTLADMSAISGRSTKEILLLRRALEDAGISMEKIDRFILTGQDRGQVIARALKNLSSGDWKEAAASVGKQADILEKNSATFDRISDLLGRSGQKLQGFFVGAAGKIGDALLPVLEKLNKLDLASQGERFGAGLLKGAQALVGVFENPKVLVQGLEDAFTAAALGLGNVLVAVLKRAGDVFGAAALAIVQSVGTRGRGKSVADRMSENLAGSKLDVTDVFGAGAALANAQTQVSRSAEMGKGMLPAAMGAASNAPSYMSPAWWDQRTEQRNAATKEDSKVPEAVKDAMETTMEKYWGKQ